MLKINELISLYEKRLQDKLEKVVLYRKDYTRLDKLRNNEFIRMQILESEIRHLKWSIDEMKMVLYHDYKIISERVG